MVFLHLQMPANKSQQAQVNSYKSKAHLILNILNWEFQLQLTNKLNNYPTRRITFLGVKLH